MIAQMTKIMTTTARITSSADEFKTVSQEEHIVY